MVAAKPRRRHRSRRTWLAIPSLLVDLDQRARFQRQLRVQTIPFAHLQVSSLQLPFRRARADSEQRLLMCDLI